MDLLVAHVDDGVVDNNIWDHVRDSDDNGGDDEGVDDEHDDDDYDDEVDFEEVDVRHSHHQQQHQFHRRLNDDINQVYSLDHILQDH